MNHRITKCINSDMVEFNRGSSMAVKQKNLVKKIRVSFVCICNIVFRSVDSSDTILFDQLSKTYVTLLA